MADRHDPMLALAGASSRRAAARPSARVRRHDRQGPGRTQRRQRDRVTGARPGSTPAVRPTADGPGRWSPTSPRPGRLAAARSRSPRHRVRPRPARRGSRGLLGDAPVLGDRRRARRRHPGRGRHPDRDAVRPQPDRGLALPGRARGSGRLPGRGRRSGGASSRISPDEVVRGLRAAALRAVPRCALRRRRMARFTAVTAESVRG